MQPAVTPDSQVSAASQMPATASLQDLFYAVAHDFRRPIRQVVAFTDLLQEKADILDDEGREWVECLAVAGAEAQLMLERFLVYSQLHNIGLVAISLDVRELCETAAAELRNRGRCAGSIAVRGEATTVTSERMLKTVLIELLDNALSYGDDESATVEIVADDAGVQICVENTGAGIPADQIDSALRAFGRLHEDQADHVGLGLTICQSALELIQGSMTFETTQETFIVRVRLP